MLHYHSPKGPVAWVTGWGLLSLLLSFLAPGQGPLIPGVSGSRAVRFVNVTVDSLFNPATLPPLPDSLPPPMVVPTPSATDVTNSSSTSTVGLDYGFIATPIADSPPTVLIKGRAAAAVVVGTGQTLTLTFTKTTTLTFKVTTTLTVTGNLATPTTEIGSVTSTATPAAITPTTTQGGSSPSTLPLVSSGYPTTTKTKATSTVVTSSSKVVTTTGTSKVKTTTAGPMATGSTQWTHTFVPYVDVTAWPPADLKAISVLTGVKYYKLGFIVSTATGEPSWGGYYSITSDFLKSLIADIRGLGGDVCVSFGGAAGSELAQVVKTFSGLLAKYQSIIDTYGVTYLDFDIEGGAIGNTASVTLRNQVLAQLKKNNPNVRIGYTLPVLPTGLDGLGTALLKSAATSGFTPDIVNIMAMDYGSATPGGSTKMGAYAIQAATATYAQIKAAGLPATVQVGVTPMIGKNDDVTLIFSLANAAELVAWATSTAWVGELSFWSINRDKTGSGSSVDYQSGIPQNPWDFVKAFLKYQG